MTVDEILATGRYTDRKGRKWARRPSWTAPDGRGVWSRACWLAKAPGGVMFKIIGPDQMRLLIERDQHKCDGLYGLFDCLSHPVPIVIVGYDNFEWGDFRVRFQGSASAYDTHAEAMSAARALAVGE